VLPPVRFPLTLPNVLFDARIGGPNQSETLEEVFAAYFGFPHGLIFPYARVALHALITAHGWRHRKILCPAYTCAVVPLTVEISGNIVEFVDCAPDHFLPRAAEWADRVTADTKMMIVTPLYGYPVDKSSEILARTRAPGIFVLYDETQSLGTSDGSGLQARDADGALFSLGSGKLLPALSGGLLLLRSEAVYREVRALRNAQCSKSTLGHLARRITRALVTWAALREPVFSSLLYAGRFISALSLERISARELTETKFPSDRLVLPSPSYQARISLRQLDRLGCLTAARRRYAEFYDRRLQREGFKTFAYAATPTWTRYPLAVSDRTKVIMAFASEKIQLGWFIRYTCEDMSIMKDRKILCPNARIWAEGMINLPNWPGVSMADAERCVALLLGLRDRDEHALAWPLPSSCVDETLNRGVGRSDPN
jgi:dTDP-4-amino-4,6-dideoxygalactose transaminase